MPSIQRPTQNFISQAKHGDYNAVDYSARRHKWSITKKPNWYAPESAKVTSIGNSGDCGLRIELTSIDKRRRYGFCHNERAYVKVGQKVVRGQLVGKMGFTGLTVPKGEGGRHLHQVCLSGNRYQYPPNLVNTGFRSYPKGYPKTVTVTATPYLNIREKPTTKSKDLGNYKKGASVVVIDLVKGQKIGKTNMWYRTSEGKYIWSGGTKG